MEGYNSFNEDRHNHNAEIYCTKHNIFMTSGSDLHKIGSLAPDRHYGMGFEHPIKSAADYVNAILKRDGVMLVKDSSRSLPPDIHTELPVYVNNRAMDGYI